MSKKQREEEATVEAILDRIREARNFDFRNYKRATLRRRIERRMSDRGCKSVADYLALLERQPAEFDALIASMLIKVTSFFRDQEMWDDLARKVLPQVLAEKRAGEEVRVWCAGCATGEEAFSVAILLAEAMGGAFHQQEVKIFGTDADEKAIAFARQGVYSRESVSQVPQAWVEKYFVSDGGELAIRKELRRAVVFGVNNLVSDAPISRLDLILCRNVFIYLDAALQKRVLTRFHYGLRRHGALVLGKSELIPFAGKIFEPIDLAKRIYRKDGRRDAAASQERLLSLLEQEKLARSSREVEPEQVAERFHLGVLQSMTLPLIGTAADGTILLWNAAAASLWGRAESEVLGKRLAAVNLPGLTGDVIVEKSAAVREGRSEEAVRCPGRARRRRCSCWWK
jgi:two-component system CheB/CheR fusion protein